MVDTTSLSPSSGCPHCQSEVNLNDRFCGQCGKEIKLAQTHNEDVFVILSPMLIYYFITLILLATYKLTSLFPEGFSGMVTISIIDIALVIVFWGYSFRQLKPLFSVSGLSIRIFLLTTFGAGIGSVVVSFLANLINLSVSDDVFYNPYLFSDTSSPFLMAVLFICIQPAIFEEVAFRGFLFSNLEKVTSPNTAVYITGFVFGIIHLSIIGLLWLVPIGLVFAFLRMKYNTLWYGIMGHFTYNLGIILIEFANV
jgi:uncharacterized protein